MSPLDPAGFVHGADLGVTGPGHALGTLDPRARQAPPAEERRRPGAPLHPQELPVPDDLLAGPAGPPRQQPLRERAEDRGPDPKELALRRTPSRRRRSE